MYCVRLLPVGAVLLCTWASPAKAQSLADMAKRAEEQRKAADGRSIRIEMVPARQLRTLPIDKYEVETYVNLRVALAQLWHLDHPLFERVRGGSLMARSLNEWTKALESEPEVARVLKKYNYSAEAVLAMSKSIEEAEQLTEGGFDMNSLSPVQLENYHFAGKNKVWLSLMRGRIYRAEGGLTIWR